MAAVGKMKILLIGNSGQLGRELENSIKNTHHQLISFNHQELDITNSDSVREKITEYHPEIVINASAFHVVSECEDNPEKAFEINSYALLPIAKLCNDIKIKFVTFSSDYVFDGLKGKSYLEDDKPNPLQVYGVSKLAGEFIALNYCQRAVVIRTCGVYGGKEGSRSKKGNFVINILRQAKGKDTLEVSSEQVVSPTYAADLANATLKLLAQDQMGVFHLVNEGSCSWAEFASEIMSCASFSTNVIPVDRRGMDGSVKKPLFSVLSNTLAKRVAVILPTWQNAVSRYINTIDLENI